MTLWQLEVFDPVTPQATLVDSLKRQAPAAGSLVSRYGFGAVSRKLAVGRAHRPDRIGQRSDVVSVKDMSAVQSQYIPGWVSSPPAGHAQFLLQQISPSTSERKLTQKAILFGRVEQVCDVVVNHVSASRVHAVVAYDGAGTLQLADLGSTHGKKQLIVRLLETAVC